MSDFNNNFEPNLDPNLQPNSQEGFITGLDMAPEIRSNIFLGFIGGLASSIIGAGLWAGITVLTGYQIGFMAIGVGFLVGMCIRVLGKGSTLTYAVMGAVFALLGCMAGNVLSMYGIFAKEFQTTIGNAYNLIGPIDMLKETFQPMDLLFYALAVYEGFRFSIFSR